jgi:hypothetical protein
LLHYCRSTSFMFKWNSFSTIRRQMDADVANCLYFLVQNWNPCKLTNCLNPHQLCTHSVNTPNNMLRYAYLAGRRIDTLKSFAIP